MATTQPPSQAPTKVSSLALHLPASDTALRLHLTAYTHALVLYIVPGASTLAPSLSSSTNTASAGGSADAETHAAAMAGGSGAAGEGAAGAGEGIALGSLVYALPDITHAPATNGSSASKAAAKPVVHATALYATPATHDLAARLARVLASRARRPTYVGVGRGLRFWSVEDEGAAVRGVVQAVLERVGA